MDNLKAHVKGAEVTVFPMAREKTERRPAVAQAHPFHGRQLVQRGADDHAAGDVRASFVPGEEREVERANALKHRVRQHARSRPFNGGSPPSWHWQRGGHAFSRCDDRQ